MNQVTPLSQTLLLQAPNNRHGIALEPQRASVSFSDIRDIIHMGVPSSIESPWESASGGVARNEQAAKLAAIGEAVERYSASMANLPLRPRVSIAEHDRLDAAAWCLFSDEQKNSMDFPFGNIYSDNCRYTNTYSLTDNREIWVPHPFVVLRDDYQTGIPTSSGLAAGPTPHHALLMLCI